MSSFDSRGSRFGALGFPNTTRNSDSEDRITFFLTWIHGYMYLCTHNEGR
jgi:hypothetical protein